MCSRAGSSLVPRPSAYTGGLGMRLGMQVVQKLYFVLYYITCRSSVLVVDQVSVSNGAVPPLSCASTLHILFCRSYVYILERVPMYIIGLQLMTSVFHLSLSHLNRQQETTSLSSFGGQFFWTPTISSRVAVPDYFWPEYDLPTPNGYKLFDGDDAPDTQFEGRTPSFSQHSSAIFYRRKSEAWKQLLDNNIILPAPFVHLL